MKRLFLASLNLIRKRRELGEGLTPGTKGGRLSAAEDKRLNPAEIRRVAENHYRRGDFYCSEAIVKTIKDAFGLPVPDTIIAMASGFPVGMGHAGCTCGAIVGGIMALGLFFGRTEPRDSKVTKAMELSRELHDGFRARHKNLCCRLLTKDMRLGSSLQMRQCIAFTGEVAEEVSKLILREMGRLSNQ